MLKNITTTKDGVKYVNDIFINAPEKQRLKVPFVLYFQQTFDREADRDTTFNQFTEIDAIGFLTQVENQMKVESKGKNKNFLN